ncbi:helix-turn-helix transcriptional regulator [Rhizobium sp. NRK18]|uniref:helix-turn-helix domain-containing protein n=1 Tax=Rhizobium sp. NRK18 TaxID=2964667 RepID=UPI0021C46684|nr:helix-turn-helix transcriptional regulator [Rhizobium sp. NRK18]MCQ2005268.1 helix-turn-helix domain-containing protein [Rhizobium sp. NRK18]
MEKNPNAAIIVGQILRDHLRASSLTTEQLAARLGFKRGAKMMNLITGRHYFSPEHIEAAVETLGIEPTHFTRAVLRQFFNDRAVDFMCKALSSGSTDTSDELAGTSREGTPKPKSKKKKRGK